jgi:hypothetical protein
MRVNYKSFCCSCPVNSFFTANKFRAAGVLKRMCTSCKTCKLRDENMYRNLDDEEKHFLVLMMGDFRDAMVTLSKYSFTLMCYIFRIIMCYIIRVLFLKTTDVSTIYYKFCVVVHGQKYFLCRVFATFWLFI